MSSVRSVGYLLATLSALAGAVRYVLAIFAQEGYSVDPVPFLLGALAVGTVISGGHVLIRDGWSGFEPLRGQTRYAALYGILMAGSTLSHFIALRYLNETVMSSLAQTSILFTLLLAVWLLSERFSLGEWIATAIILGGMAVTFIPESTGGNERTGFFIILGGAFGGALATIVAKRWIRTIPPRTMMVWRNGVGLVAVGVYAAFEGFSFPTAVAPWIACVFAGILGPYLHGLWFLQSLERIEASKASLMSRVQPVMVFVLAWLFLSRIPERMQLVGAGLLVLGTMALAIAARRAAAKPSP